MSRNRPREPAKQPQAPALDETLPEHKNRNSFKTVPLEIEEAPVGLRPRQLTELGIPEETDPAGLRPQELQAQGVGGQNPLQPGDVLSPQQVRDVGGIPTNNAAPIQEIADKGFIVKARPTSPAALEHLEAQTAAPKIMEVKAKGITPIDELIGFDGKNRGLVGLKEPTMPANFNELPPEVQNQVKARFDQRMAEFTELQPDVAKLKKLGFSVDTEGIIRDPQGKPFTSDHDLFSIERVDPATGKTRPATPAEREAVVKMLRSAGVIEHGAHLDMPTEAAKFNSDPKLQKVFVDILEAHASKAAGGTGKDPLIVFKPGEAPVVEFFEPTNAPPASLTEVPELAEVVAAPNKNAPPPPGGFVELKIQELLDMPDPVRPGPLDDVPPTKASPGVGRFVEIEPATPTEAGPGPPRLRALSIWNPRRLPNGD